jgi:tetratricopeptide (TPR) repeat protein
VRSFGKTRPWIFLLAFAILSAKPGGAQETTDPPEPTAPPMELSKDALYDRVLSLNLVQEPELDHAESRRVYQELIGKVRVALQGMDTPEQKVAALSKALLADRKVSYLSNMYWRDSTLAASLLRGKGNCLSTSTLFVLVGRELGLPIRMVIVPRHAYVRWDDGKTRINVETTGQGMAIPDWVYLYRMGQATPEDVEALGWGRSLDDSGFLAEITACAAHHRAGENRLEEALKLHDEAEQLAPQRSDMRLARITIEADITKDREKAQKETLALLQNEVLPPSVYTSALTYLARDAGSRKDFATERNLLLEAFARAPKSSELMVLQDLAFCHRSLKDFRGAVRYMELAATLVSPQSPEYPNILYCLAILQKNDDRLGEALESIRKALKLNPESWNLQVIEAGYLVLNGQREEGLAAFAKVQRPRGDAEFYEDMVAWFYAVSQQRKRFYVQFERVLELANSTHVLVWIEQDVDLDVYRNEPEFKNLVAKATARLQGKADQEPAPKEAPKKAAEPEPVGAK